MTNVEKIYKLTPLQEGILFHKLLRDDSSEYILQSSIKFEGELNIEIIRNSLSLLSYKHEVLRTAFITTEKGKPLQVIMGDRKIELIELYSNDVSELESFMENDISRGFDIKNDSLFRVSIICNVRKKESVILWTMHHIITDGWCTSLLYDDFIEYYAKLLQGNNYNTLRTCIEKEKEKNGSYDEYVRWIDKKDMRTGLLYWKQLLEGFSDTSGIIPIKTDETYSEVEKLTIQIDRKISSQLKRFAQREKITLNNIAEAVWGVVLQKYCRTNDVVFGKVVSGRNAPVNGIDNIVGLFINTVPIRVQNDNNTTLRELLHNINKQGIKSGEYDFCPLVEIQGNSELGRYLFSTLFVFENYYVSEPKNMNLWKQQLGGSIAVSGNKEQTNYDLTISAYFNGCFCFELLYNTKKYGKVDAELILMRIEKVTAEIALFPDKRVIDVDIVKASERKKILSEFNNTQSCYPHDKTIGQLFEEQAQTSPNNVAVSSGNQMITYGELNFQANQLALVLRKKGVRPDSLVGIIAERSIQTIVGILGIIKAGGAYLPIDSEYPNGRIQFILKDSEVNILLTQHGMVNQIEYSGEVLDIDDGFQFEGKGTSIGDINHSSDLAYCIYTSGTSGLPKGTLVEHKSVIQLVKNTNYIELNSTNIIMQTGSLSFDASTFEIWGALLNGGKLVIAEREAMLTAVDMQISISQYRINTMFITTALFNHMIKCDTKVFSGLQYLLFGGEKHSDKNVRKNKNSGKFIHVYGPTETTTFATYFEITADFNVLPIGKPISNTRIYILNNQLLCGIGMIGEICIGGDGLARGYLNRQELTDEKFVRNPFLPNERMYRTGDLARWLPDGNIEFCGRIDKQVKLRGFRIELEEIESRLLELDVIAEAVVIIRGEESEEKFLCAYVVLVDDTPISKIKEWLSETLPSYMIPSMIICLDTMPLNANGKINPNELPIPEIRDSAVFVAPRSKTEEVLVNIWSEVLAIDNPGIYDNFFVLGGHSLTGAIIASRIHKELDIKLPLKVLFKAQTIAEISEYIKTTVKSPYETIDTITEKPFYAVSSAQKRLFVLQQLNPDGTGYNVPSVHIVEGVFEKDRVETAIRNLVKRHEILRTSFAVDGDEIVQCINTNVDFNLEYSEQTDTYIAYQRDKIKINSQIKRNKSEEYVDDIVDKFIRPFDLSTPPLLRVGLIKLMEKRHLLLFDIHHIITDGTSMSILVKEFIELYEGRELETQRIQYKDFSEWQNAYMKSDEMIEQEKYWLSKFSDELPVLNMPLDFSRPATQDFHGSRVEFWIGMDLYEKVKAVVQRTNTTMYMVLLSAIYILLSKYTDQEDIVIGSPIAGRPHVELENMLGMFVNTLAMRNYPVSSKEYLEFLGEVKENALKAYDNQLYQFDMLIEKIDLRRDISRNPLFDVMFAMQNMETAKLKLDDLAFICYEPHEKSTKFDLEFIAAEKSNGVRLSIGYCTKLFKKETIERIYEHYCHILETISGNNEILIGEIDILSKCERSKILYEFNDTYVDYPRENTIHQLFEEQVNRTPDNVVWIYKEKTMTYYELNSKANQLARILMSTGIKPDSVVGILVERSFEMIIGILGILKAGGAYMPIDPNYPDERIRYMLEDSDAAICLIQSRFQERITFHGKVLNLDDREIFQGDGANLGVVNSACNLAYLLYTSGSTGKPKGVMMEHQSVVNRLVWMQNEYHLSEADIFLQKTSYTFDVSVGELFWCSLIGAKSCMLEQGEEKDISAIVNAIHVNNITTIHFVPSMLTVLLEYLGQNIENADISTLKRMFSSGEALNARQVFDFKRIVRKVNKVDLINFYGPTEAGEVTFFNTFDEYNDNIIPIGKPIYNTKIYILGSGNKLNPIGIAGELYISGECLARGYLKQPELTKQKFIENPYLSGERMYRTGDIARWLPDGNIEFLGRTDHQVKIRGFRVELGEIENCLMDIGTLKEVTVMAREDTCGESCLCAYIVSNQDISTFEIRELLAVKLPDYMVPTHIICIDKMPLTSNGKVDHKSLPSPVTQKKSVYFCPQTREETTLVSLMQDILKLSQIGINDNFFDLGCNSIKIIRFVARAYNEGICFTIKDVYSHPTVAGLITSINNNVFPITNQIKSDINKYSSILVGNRIDENFIPSKKIFKNVLITGSTGFLGAHILAEYLINEKGTAYCIVREKNQIEATTRLHKVLSYYFGDRFKDSKRIVVLNGNITQPIVCDESIDMIIHCAANVKHYGLYKDFYDVNVLSVKNVVEFAKKRHIKVLHISTIGVFDIAQDFDTEKDIVFSEGSMYVSDNTDNVYIRSKIEAEIVIMDAMRMGIQANIIRVGNLTNRYSDAKFQINYEENAFLKKIKALIDLKILPEELLTQKIELSPVDCVAEAIIKIAQHFNDRNTIFHVNHSNVILLSEFYDVLKLLKVKMEIVRFNKISEFSGENWNSKNRDAFYEAFIADFTENSKRKNNVKMMIDNKITSWYLGQIGFHWPDIDKRYIEMYIKYFIETGYFTISNNGPNALS